MKVAVEEFLIFQVLLAVTALAQTSMTWPAVQ
jgi:hypothetical protein